MAYVVEIVSHDTKDTVKQFKPTSSQRQAEKVERGVEINLDHENYFTRIAALSLSDVNAKIAEFEKDLASGVDVTAQLAMWRETRKHFEDANL